MDSAEATAEEIPDADKVSSVEVCECPPGYHGTSCEDCALGYYRHNEGPFGPICFPCNCHGHAEICHPLTGQCVAMKPLPGFGPQDDGSNLVVFFR